MVIKRTLLLPPLSEASWAGVRVLFQVAVVLVRRVLGRAEQRQECPGQMETLERLRGVRASPGLQDDASFMAEVPSTPLGPPCGDPPGSVHREGCPGGETSPLQVRP